MDAQVSRVLDRVVARDIPILNKLAPLARELTSEGRKLKLGTWHGVGQAVGEWQAASIPKLREFCRKNAKVFWEAIEVVREMRTRTRSPLRRDQDSYTGRLMLPPMLDHLVPVTTEGDGNCLYHAVSLSLFGHERYHRVFRALALFVLLSLKTTSLP